MSIAIKVRSISKQYRIGLADVKHDNLGATIVSWIKSPFRNFKRLSSLSKFKNAEDKDIFHALYDISFDVSEGEVLGIIGKNGAGKSTLLKILSRITEPSGGEIEIHGKVASLLEVGTGFNPELTGRENIYLNGTILGMTKAEIDDKLTEIIAFSGIEKFIETPVKRYSSGMKVRLAFSVAAHLDPDILIIDEVLAVGDVEFQNKCLGKMQEVSGKQGRTVLFVSHDMSAVSTLCTRSILLEGGKIREIGDTFDIISKYLEKSAQTSNLMELERTKGNQSFKIKTMDISSSLIDHKRVISGRPLYFTIELHTEIDESEITEMPIVDFRVDNSVGQRLFWLSNSLKLVEATKSYKKLIFAIDKCPLSSGLYNVTINVNYKNENADWLSGAVDFEVMEGQFFETSKLPPNNQGDFLLDFELN